MVRHSTIPAHIEPGAPFLGLLGDTAAGRVAHHLIATDDAVTVSELARATDLSRVSARKAVLSFVAWGLVEAQAEAGGWTRYRVDKASPINIALELLIGALNDAQEPGQGLFETYAEVFAGVQLKKVREPFLIKYGHVSKSRRQGRLVSHKVRGAVAARRRPAASSAVGSHSRAIYHRGSKRT
jgi:predicted DNA-binding transcriptional regulator